MRYAAALVLPFFLLFCSCGRQQATTTGAVTDTTVKSKEPVVQKPAESNLSPNGTQALVDLTQTYMKLKEAMIAGDTTAADVAGSRLMSAAESMHLELSYMQVKRDTMMKQLDTVAKQSELLTNIRNDKNCDNKRVPFARISDVVFAIAKAAQLKNVPLYRDFCPMAFDSKGAYWISTEEEIRNPYFGKKMIDCGEVQDTLK